MSATRLRRARVVQPPCQDGFTLVEVVISVVIMSMIAGALAAAFITSMSASTNSRRNLRESNNAQLVAAFFTRDVQSAGGLDPATGTYDDPTLGISVQDAAGCASAGTLKLRVKWIERMSTTTIQTYVVIYSYADPVPQTAPPSKDLVRTTCVDSLATGASVLATHLSTVVVPVVTCTGRVANCKSSITVVPDSVSMTIRSEDTTLPPYKFYGSLRVSDAAPPPTVVSITSSAENALNGQNGTPEPGDTITITFSSPIGPTSVCSTWAPGNNSLSSTTTTVTLTSNPFAHDTLSVADAECTLNIFSGGSLDLGTSGYVTGTPPTPPPPAIFGNSLTCNPSLGHCSTVAIDDSDTVLTITLGDLESGTVGAVPASPGITYNPDPAIAASGFAIDPDPFF